MIDDPNEEWRAILSRPMDVESFHPLSSAVALDVAATSVCGTLNVENTDHYLAIRFGRTEDTLTTSLPSADLPPRFEEYSYALLVADGMGGERAGARASRIALSALAHLAIRHGRWNIRLGPETTGDIIEQGEFFYRRVNDAVFQAGRTHKQLAEMATSLTALYVIEDDLFFAHVGHSKGFLFRDGALIELTTSHALEASRQAIGRTAVVDRGRRDAAHVVTDTIGGRPTPPTVNIEHLKLSRGDRLLLCTNGLSDVISTDQIADVLAPRRRPQEDCQRLVALALDSGSTDDVTVLLADYTLREDRRGSDMAATTTAVS